MNRLVYCHYPKAFSHQAVNVRQTLDTNSKIWFISAIEPNHWFYAQHTQNLSSCDATDYQNYKEWVAYWKRLYAHVSTYIRTVKKHMKTYQKESNLINRCNLESKVATVRVFPDTALKFLKDLANYMLRVRQQMKMWNKYYMVNHDRTNAR